MRYALLIHADPANGPAYGSPEQEAEMAGYFAFNAEAAEAGVLQVAEALQPAETAVTLRGGTRGDGPALPGPESLGGFYILTVADQDEALAWAAKLPPARYGAIEVRPIFEVPGR